MVELLGLVTMKRDKAILHVVPLYYTQKEAAVHKKQKAYYIVCLTI